MNVEYDWRTTLPGERLVVHIDNSRDGARFFDATMTLERREVTGPNLAWALARFPLMTLRVVLWIHWEALKLWLKKTPFYPHPKHSRDCLAELSGRRSEPWLRGLARSLALSRLQKIDAGSARGSTKATPALEFGTAEADFPVQRPRGDPRSRLLGAAGLGRLDRRRRGLL